MTSKKQYTEFIAVGAENMMNVSETEPMRVLFLCTHNSSRSQMAEGLLRARGGKRYTVYSAGTHPRTVHSLAVPVMAELGIDISELAGHRAKSMEEFVKAPPMDLVITVCDEAAEECPYFPHARQQEHWGFPDSRSRGNRRMGRLLIIGGSDAGISTALRAREFDAESEVTVVVADRFPNYSICASRST